MFFNLYLLVVKLVITSLVVNKSSRKDGLIAELLNRLEVHNTGFNDYMH